MARYLLVRKKEKKNKKTIANRAVLSYTVGAGPPPRPLPKTMKFIAPLIIAFEESAASTKVAFFGGLLCLGFLVETIEAWKAVAACF